MQNQIFSAIDIFNHNSHLTHLSAKESFSKFIKYFWRYSISAGTAENENVGKLTLLYISCDVDKPPSSVFQWEKKAFDNSLNTVEDIAISVLGQCKGENWNLYLFWMLEKL